MKGHILHAGVSFRCEERKFIDAPYSSDIIRKRRRVRVRVRVRKKERKKDRKTERQTDRQTERKKERKKERKGKHRHFETIYVVDLAQAKKEKLKFHVAADRSITCFTQNLAGGITKIMRFRGRTIYDRGPYNEERQWKVLRSNDDKISPSPLQFHQPCLHMGKCQRKTERYTSIHRDDHVQHEKKRDSISGCSVKNANRAGSAKN